MFSSHNRYNIGGLPQVLAPVLAQIVQFAHDYFFSLEEDFPETEIYTVAHICACFIAQHTPLGANGVDMEVPLAALRISERMPYSERLALAVVLVEEHQSFSGLELDDADDND